MIIGVDEVGRGCWAGPLVVGAVGLGSPIAGLADSKLLSRRQRDELNRAICSSPTAVIGLGWVSADEIDTVGLSGALTLAAERALSTINLDGVTDIIVDGNYNFIRGVARVRTVVKADTSFPSVSAASIIAKVARDTYMIKQAKRYPLYGFDRHVGYGTKQHKQSLEAHGITPLHRKSFAPVKNRLQQELAKT